MATVSKVDDLSKDERQLIIDAIKMLKASNERSAKSSRSQMIADIYRADAVRCDALIAKFL